MERISLLIRNKISKTENLGSDYTCVLPLINQGKTRIDDRISELPDDILVNVLSRLTMKEEVHASVLSR